MREPRDYEAPLCAQIGGDHWFPEVTGTDSSSRYHTSFAKTICGRCVHQTECAEWGIQNERFGIWGGLTAVELKTARRTRNIKPPKEGYSA